MRYVFLLLTLLSISSHGEEINLTATNSVVLRNEINIQVVDSTISKLATIVSQRKDNTPIYLVLDSPGGSIEAGLSFIEYAKTIKNLHTITIFSASMASAIVEALPGKRYILESGIIMFHRASGGVSGQFESGELESRLALDKKIVLSIETKNAERLSLPLQSYKDKVRDEYWLVGGDAVKEKTVDSIVTITCSPELFASKPVEDLLIGGFIPIKVQFSDCPLLRSGSVVSPGDQSSYFKYLSESKKGFKY